MATVEIVETVGKYVTDYRVHRDGRDVTGRSFTSRERAEAVAALVELLPGGYQLNYAVQRAGSMNSNYGWYLTGPAWKSIYSADPTALIVHLQYAIEGEAARVAKANAKANEQAAAKIEREMAATAEQIRQEMDLATDKQVGYIMTLLAKRARTGDGGGFMSGPTTIEGVRAMKRADASLYIDSLTERY